MGRPKIAVKELECKKCGHKWIPRKSYVRTCPKVGCRTPYWDVPYSEAYQQKKREEQGDGEKPTETETKNA